MERLDLAKALQALELDALEQLARIVEKDAPVRNTQDYEQMIIEEYADFVAENADIM